METQRRLAVLKPDFFSVTYGIGESTQDKTLETVINIQKDTGIVGVPHLSCISSQLEEIKHVLNQYKQEGFSHLVALRGDLLSSGAIVTGPLCFAYQLIELIRNETGDHFQIEVACYPEFHPETKNPSRDLENFKQKVDTGADSAITQYFYNPDAYFRFIDSCEKLGINIPIVPGIMTITNNTKLIRFSESCGAEIPAWILKRLQEFGDDRESIRAFGIDVVTELCANLLSNGAPGLHIYTMNQSEASLAIWDNLGLGG